MEERKTIFGKNGISAEMVMYSEAPNGKRIATLNVKYGLIIHAELLRHRVISHSVKSNRAIPMKKIREEVRECPYVPVWFGAAQKGMVADVEMERKRIARKLWLAARYPAMFAHWVAEKMGAHKEWANRLLNPWQYVRETITATEWDNLFELRLHTDAQKDIQELVRLIAELLESCTPMKLQVGEWHVPYVIRQRTDDGVLRYFDNNDIEMTPNGAIVASTARVARSSYDNHDNSDATLRGDTPLYNRLIDSKPCHSSPAEHPATPMQGFPITVDGRVSFPKGVTHYDHLGRHWSGNLIGWVQHRQLLEDHVTWQR